jgi:hypothetical protein
MKKLIESRSLVFEVFNSSFGAQDANRKKLQTTKKRNVNFKFFIPLN